MTSPIAVAMSGGLDSSVAACLLEREGHRVIGLSMLLWDRSAESRNGRCCGSLDLGDARRVARQLDIPHYTLRLEDDFEQAVVAPFVDEYVAGRTPSPCIACNTWIKFDAFLERARRVGAERIATGHYARIVEGDGGLELHRALDEHKDQSYFLFELDQRQLARAVFPLGSMTKQQVREEARSQGLVVAEKGESMEICFVSGGIQEFLEERLDAAGSQTSVRARGGSELVDADGRHLGVGAPYYRYTVGQRRGLGVAAGRRLYVLEIRPQENRVVVGAHQELLQSGFRGDRVHWVGEPPGEEVEAVVRIRSRHAGVAGCIRPGAGRRVEVELAEPQAGITPGQAAVFYSGTRVLGGCWIDHCDPARRPW